MEENREWKGHTANTKDPTFYVIDLGEFDKGVVNGDGVRLKGREFIWCKGDYIKGIDG
ncbi:MAG: hypothetical protein HFJ05_08150 [Eubacterium sp.]|nr:hypothetical protein [Eubacterium sp.]